MEHVCDVCRLLDGDNTIKECFYCSLCDAFICAEDSVKWMRRGAAAVKRSAEKMGILT